MRVAVFAKGAKADEAKAAGADVVGAEEGLMEVAVQGGQIDFDQRHRDARHDGSSSGAWVRCWAPRV